MIYTESITKTCLFKYTENLSPKNENFQKKNSDIFQISAQNIVRTASEAVLNEYLQSMFFFSRDKKNDTYPCKPQFYYIKVGFKGVKII